VQVDGSIDCSTLTAAATGVSIRRPTVSRVTLSRGESCYDDRVLFGGVCRLESSAESGALEADVIHLVVVRMMAGS